ncbi:MAG: Gfo/Idh/MocA family oxidoreductase [Lentisphaeria bacterium]|nr:Gfo/Idh/MocA family oxidoreductase [Lentisphaeria bacterium]MBQ8753579.1 Gfo/Idh/MocA family oxidoreductase [Lentisphaeria bacterium]
MDIVKFGIVGVGNMGSCHVGFIEAIPNAKLTAVCDVDPAAFDRIKPEIREKIKCFADVDTFLAEGDIDAVIVAVPHYSHPDIAIKAMNAGKHIIVEKPIAVHKAEAERLIAEAAKHPELVKSLMFNQRTIPAHQKIKEMIENGTLGKITRINWIITDWFRTQRYYDSGDWRASWRGEGGGVLLNQCPHQLDLWQWLFGMPKTMRAFVKFGKYHDIEVEDEVNAYMEYENGTVGNFIASTGEMPGTNRLEITAENGRLIYEKGDIQFRRNEIPTSVFCKTSEKSFALCDSWECKINIFDADNTTPQHQKVIANVTNAILNGTPLIAPMEEGIRGLELGNSMLLSGLLDKTLTLPIDSALYAAELEKLIASSRYQKKTVAAVVGNFNKSF